MLEVCSPWNDILASHILMRIRQRGRTSDIVYCREVAARPCKPGDLIAKLTGLQITAIERSN